MSDLPRIQRNKKTGELRASYDNGATWQPVALPPPGTGGEPKPVQAAPGAAVPEPTPAPDPPPATPAPVPPLRPASGGGPSKQGFGDALGDRAASFGAWVKGAPASISKAVQAPFRHPYVDQETTADFGAGLGQGVTLGWGDEIAAGLTPEVDDGTGIPREYAAGSAYADMRNQNRRDVASAQQRSPTAFGTGVGVGAASTAGLANAVGVPVLPAVLTEGAVGGAGFSNEDDPTQLAADMTFNAGLSGLTGGVPAAVARSRAASAPARATALRAAAGEQHALGQKAYARKLGAQPGQISNLEARSSGPGAVRAYPDEAAELMPDVNEAGVAPPGSEALPALEGGLPRYVEGGRARGITSAATARAEMMAARAEKDAISDRMRGAGAGLTPTQMADAIEAPTRGNIRGGISGGLKEASERQAQTFRDMPGYQARDRKIVTEYPDKVYPDMVEQNIETLTAKLPPYRGKGGRMISDPLSVDIVEQVPRPLETFDAKLPPKRGAGGRLEPDSVSVDVVSEEMPMVRERVPPDVRTERIPERTMGWDTVNDELGLMGKKTNFASGTPESEARAGWYGSVNEALQGAAEQAEPGAGNAWRAAKEREHVARMWHDIANKAETRGVANRKFGLTDTVLAAGGAAAGGAIGGVPGAIAGAVAGGSANRVLRGAEPHIAEALHGYRERSALRGAARAEAPPGVLADVSETGAAGPVAAGSYEAWLGAGRSSQNDNPADEPPNEVDRDAAENDQMMRDAKARDEMRRKAERQRQ